MLSRTVRLSLVCLLFAALVACGDDDDTASAPPDDSSENDEGSGDRSGAYPVTIDHAFGVTEIPEEPERVVSLGYTEQDSLVLFDVEPIAVRYAFGPEDDVFFPWADDAAGGADPVILPRAEVNAEQIAALDPDLIMAVTAGLDEQQYDTLSQIAPTVVQPAEYPAFATPWQVQTRVAGRAFGQEARAEEIIGEVEDAIEAARQAHPEFEGRSLVLSGPTYDGNYPFHASDDARTRFFVELGFVVPSELDEIAGDQFYGTVSRERADLLDADVLVWQAGSAEERAAIEADSVLASLPVVQEGRALFADGVAYDALQFTSALSISHLLDDFVPELAEVVEGR